MMSRRKELAIFFVCVTVFMLVIALVTWSWKSQVCLIGAVAYAAEAPAPPSPVVKATIDGPVEVEVGRTVDFAITGADADQLEGAKIILFPEGRTTYWRIFSEWGTGKPVPVFQSSEPGFYMILLAYYDGLAVQMEKHEFRVVGEGPGPEPDPNPDPVPPPPPPVVENLWVLFLYESSKVDDAGNEQVANITTSQRIRRLGSGKVDIDFLDKDVRDEDGGVPAALKPWLAYVEQEDIDLPAVLFIDKDGGLMAARDWGDTVDENVELIREYLP